MRKGTVAAINPNRGMVALLTEEGGYTIIELLSEWGIELGDVISWENDHGLGSEIYKNVTQNEISEVYVQNHHVNSMHLKQQLLIK